MQYTIPIFKVLLIHNLQYKFIMHVIECTTIWNYTVITIRYENSEYMKYTKHSGS